MTRWTSAAARRIIAAAGGEVDVPAAVEIVANRIRGNGVPTDLETVADRLNVSGWHAEAIPVAGELRRDGVSFMIAYASGMPAGRRRFTIAHELGHAFFETTGPSCPKVGEELERICDRFAAALLLPASHLIEDLDVWGPSAVIHLSNKYHVSLSALLRRAEEIGDRHGVILDATGAPTAATAMVGRGPDAHDVLRRIAVRAAEGYSGEVVLPRNRRWNGTWQLAGQALAGGNRVLVTGVPVDVAGAPIPRRTMLVRPTT